ncbi:hypothetical protein ACU4HD_47900 [Cupriavidus basilensis]
MKVVPYCLISATTCWPRSLRIKLGRIRDRVAINHKATFQWDNALVESVLARCTEVDAGARAVDHILNGTLLPQIAESVLTRMAEGAASRRSRSASARTASSNTASTKSLRWSTSWSLRPSWQTCCVRRSPG